MYATKPIPSGTIITYFPVHAIKIKDDIDICGTQDDEFIKKMNIMVRDYGSYISLIKDISIIGNPNNTSNKLLLGHMINDPSGNVFKDIKYDDTKNLINFKNIFAAYYMNGSKKRNCTFKMDDNECVLCVVTTRNINANEELLEFKEPQYWYNYTYGINVENYAYDHTIKIMSDNKFIDWLRSLLQ